MKESLGGKFAKAGAAIIAEYRGLTMAELTELRIKLRESDSEFKVIKNRIAKVAIDEDANAMEPLKEHLTGPVGVVFIYGDPAAAAKSALEFQKQTKDVFSVKAGLMDGKEVSVNDLKAIADLPSKDVLLAKIVGSMVSPHRGLLGVLNGVPRQLVQVINAIKDTKS